MFDSNLDSPAALTEVDDAGLIDEVTVEMRAMAAAAGRHWAAIAELTERRCAAEIAAQRELWSCDAWDSVAGELSAAQTISPQAASKQMDQGLALRHRLPGIAALLLAGAISADTAAAVIWRTRLIDDPEVAAAVDRDLVGKVRRWGRDSKAKLITEIDALIGRHDPAAVIAFRASARGRDVRFGDQDDTTGITTIYGQLLSPDGEIGQRRLDAAAHSVCDEDPRSIGERRSDALGIILAGGDVLPCRCESPDCPNTAVDARAQSIVIHVITNSHPNEAGERGGPNGPTGGDSGPSGPSDVEGGPAGHAAEPEFTDNPNDTADSDDNAEPDCVDDLDDETEPEAPAELNDAAEPEPIADLDPVEPDAAEQDSDSGAGSDTTDELDSSVEPDDAAPTATTPPPCPPTAVTTGGAIIPAELLAELARIGAAVRTVPTAETLRTETGYRPSALLARFVRTRDVTCCFPGCNRPAENTDIDHTTAYGVGGLTHAGNLTCLCRKHHLSKPSGPGRAAGRTNNSPTAPSCGPHPQATDTEHHRAADCASRTGTPPHRYHPRPR